MTSEVYPSTPEETLQLSNFDINAIVTPIRIQILENLLISTNYDPNETQFLVDGFTNGFKLGYSGSKHVRITANNLKFRVGDKFDLWHKIMTEVAAKRYAGPYDDISQIPFPEDGESTGWIQSPCGLVAKSNNRTRLINHHSFPPGASLNDGIDDEHSKVTYQDFQKAIQISLQLQAQDPSAQVCYSKLDGKNAFRVLSLHPSDRRWQVLKAENPLTGKFVYFVDLCVSFGNRASCFLYESFSRALAHIYAAKTGVEGVSYLDDALQVGLGIEQTNQYLGVFLQICDEINMPVAQEKTVCATPIIIFLGMLINAINNTIGIPDEKVAKALNQIELILGSKKITVLQIQQITGLLNFFCRAIVPGRAFTRRMYAAYAGNATKPHYHVRVSSEMKLDLKMWRQFLLQEKQVLRPFVDFDSASNFADYPIYSDAAKSERLGFASCFFINHEKLVYYCFDRWEPLLLQQCDPSVQFLELVGLAAGVILFSPLLTNKRVTLHCDNQAVVQMINNGASSCKFCMVLIRMITLHTLRHNVRIEAKFVKSEDNYHADLLSRMKHDQFMKAVPEGFKTVRLPVPAEMMPISKIFNI